MTVEIRIAASVETFARWQLAADRASFPLHEWIVVYLNVASDPDAGQVVDVVESLNSRLVVAEANAESRQARVEAAEGEIARLETVVGIATSYIPAARFGPYLERVNMLAPARAALAVSGNQPQ